jgi:hypothetical protein
MHLANIGIEIVEQLRLTQPVHALLFIAIFIAGIWYSIASAKSHRRALKELETVHRTEIRERTGTYFTPLGRYFVDFVGKSTSAVPMRSDFVDPQEESVLRLFRDGETEFYWFTYLPNQKNDPRPVSKGDTVELFTVGNLPTIYFTIVK